MSSEFTYESVSVHRDARGSVFEPLDWDLLRRQANAHVVLTVPGEVRGNHYHKRGAEVAILMGPALVRIRQEDQIRDIEVPNQEVYRFYFPPGLPHAIQNTGDGPLVLVAFNSEVHDPKNPDVVRDILIEANAQPT